MQSKISSIITMTVFSLSALWYNNASAANKADTLKGTITLGASGYGVRLESGKIIGFMGRGGNKVFAICHNGERCEITGIVAYDIKNPLFISIQSVRRLGGKAKAVADTTTPQTSADKTVQTTPAQSSAEQSDNSSPLLLENNSSQ